MAPAKEKDERGAREGRGVGQGRELLREGKGSQGRVRVRAGRCTNEGRGCTERGQGEG